MTTEFTAAGSAGRRPIDPATGTYYGGGQVTGWTGWLAFAATMLMLIGVFHVIEGFVGLFKDDYFAVTKDGLLVEVSYTAWGWAHLLLGVIAIGVGAGIFLGQMWARVVGVLLAIVSTVANIAFVDATPVWSITLIAFNILVLWALTVHGGEMRDRNVDRM